MESIVKRRSRGTRWHLSRAEKRALEKYGFRFGYEGEGGEEMKRRVEKAIAREELRKANPLRWLTPWLWPNPWRL